MANRIKMESFVLGRILPDETIVEFAGAEIADERADEWCYVEAPSLPAAKSKFDSTFNRLKREGKITGAFTKGELP